MCVDKEVERRLKIVAAERSAWLAYEATRDVAKAEWMKRGAPRPDATYEAARRAAWGVYENAVHAACRDNP